MARHGGRSNSRPATGGGNRPPVPRDVLVSKKMSWILRHGAVKEGLKLDESGYANCGELVWGFSMFRLPFFGTPKGAVALYDAWLFLFSRL